MAQNGIFKAVTILEMLYRQLVTKITKRSNIAKFCYPSGQSPVYCGVTDISDSASYYFFPFMSYLYTLIHEPFT